MEQLVLALALMCQKSVDIWSRDEYQRVCVKQILDCYTKDDSRLANSKKELRLLSKCLVAVKP